MNSKKILMDCIRLNGIQSYIQWKAEVIKETYYDENGKAYIYTHPVYEYLLKLAAYGPFHKWDN